MAIHHKVPKYEYLRKIYDSESMMDFDLTKLGVAGWKLTGVVRYNPSPARVTFMCWYCRELLGGKGVTISTPEEGGFDKKFGLYAPEAKKIGDGVGRVPGPTAPPIQWPELIPGINPFDVDEDEEDERNSE